MPNLSPAQRRAVIARAARAAQRDPSPEAQAALDEARAEYRVVSLEEHIQAVVSQAGPLSAEQRDRLALLLGGAA